jgi:hypothetical protein
MRLVGTNSTIGETKRPLEEVTVSQNMRVFLKDAKE